MIETTTISPVVGTATFVPVPAVTNDQRFEVREPVDLLPPLLKRRIEEFQIAMPPWAPVFDRIFVVPLADQMAPEKVGTLFVPGKTREQHVAQLGVVVKMGMRAHEELYGHGIELGHIVLVARFSPWIREFATSRAIHQVLILRSSDIVGSDDLDAQLRDGVFYSRSNYDGRLQLGTRERRDPAESDEG